MTLRPLLLFALLASTGCGKLLGPKGDGGTPVPVRDYPDGTAGLKALFSDILEAARKDERERVHQLFATTMMSDEDFTVLLGPRAKSLRPRYLSLMGTLVNRGAVELVAQVYERKYDTVEVLPIDPNAKDARDSDRAFARALAQPVQLYSVRLKHAGRPGASRYDLFFYRQGHFRTGNLLGKFLSEEESSKNGRR